MVFNPQYIGYSERVTTNYANQNLTTNMNILYDLLFGRRGTTVEDLDDASIPGETDDWQVISTISAGELDTDLYFKWSADINNIGVINGEIGWRHFGSPDVTLIKTGILNDTSVALKRLLHSVEDNQGIIEIVGRNSATSSVTVDAANRWRSTWRVRYRWTWEETASRTERVPYQVTVRTPYQVSVRQAYTVRIPYTQRVPYACDEVYTTQENYPCTRTTQVQVPYTVNVPYTVQVPYQSEIFRTEFCYEWRVFTRGDNQQRAAGARCSSVSANDARNLAVRTAQGPLGSWGGLALAYVTVARQSDRRILLRVVTRYRNVQRFRAESRTKHTLSLIHI